MSMGYFTHPGKMSEQAYARLKKSLAETSEHGGRHRKQILEEGMTFGNTTYSIEQMQVINARLFLLRAVARAYRISPLVLYDLEAGGVDVTRLGWQFVTFTLMPWCQRWTSEINSKLLQPPYFCRFNFTPFSSADPNARSARQRTLFSVGAMSVNEIRHEEGMNRLDQPEADMHFVPLNMVPLDKASEMGLKPSPTGGDPDKGKPGAPTGGDGVTPGEFQPAVGEKQSAVSGAEALAAVEPLVANNLALLQAEVVVADTLARMGRIEAKEAINAAKDPKSFLPRIDGFYAGHVEMMKDALKAPVKAVVLLREGPYAGGLSADIELDNTINEHVAGKRQALLAAAECKASELPARWPRRSRNGARHDGGPGDRRTSHERPKTGRLNSSGGSRCSVVVVWRRETIEIVPFSFRQLVDSTRNKPNGVELFFAMVPRDDASCYVRAFFQRKRFCHLSKGNRSPKFFAKRQSGVNP